MLEGYRQQFGHRLDKFVDIEIPRALGTLSESERAIVFAGSGNFPKDIVKAVLSLDVEQQQKIHDIVAIVGTWMIASSGACWAIGSIGEDPYGERIGIGIENTTVHSFTPLLEQIEALVHNKSERDENLDLLAAFSEFDKRQATK